MPRRGGAGEDQCGVEVRVVLIAFVALSMIPWKVNLTSLFARSGGAVPGVLAGADSGWEDAGIVIAAQGRWLRDYAAVLGGAMAESR